MDSKHMGGRVGDRVGRVLSVGVVAFLSGAMVLAPGAGAAKVRAEERVVSERPVDRAEIENLQRWVTAGHADWCKDPRLVAAEELWRLAPDFSGDGFEMSEASAEEGASGKHVTFEWVPPDGRAVYRVTVERFAWLLPIAKDAGASVWVPTLTEVRAQQ